MVPTPSKIVCSENNSLYLILPGRVWGAVGAELMVLRNYSWLLLEITPLGQSDSK